MTAGPGAAPYEDYPIRIVLTSSLVALMIYAIGASLIYQFGSLWLALYIIYIALLELQLLKHCADCYYYGRRCAFGKGRLCAVFLRRGKPDRFKFKEVTWIEIMPDFLVFLIPLGAGMLLLAGSFDWGITVLLVLLLVLSTGGNWFVRGCLACKHCKQAYIGCPALERFRGK